MPEPSHDWRASFRAFIHPRVVTMLFLGLSAGLPLLLIFSSLSLWLREAGVERAAVTFFSWAALGYSFKFVWAPLVDRLPIPFLTRRLGRRRAWMLVAQVSVICAIVWMATINPAMGQLQMTSMALAAVMLGFSSATQDIVIDAYRIEAAEPSLQAMMSSTYIAGYRVGMLLSGAGALFLASHFGSTRASYDHGAWMLSYLIMAGFMLIGVVTTLIIREPEVNATAAPVHGVRDNIGFFVMFVLAAAGFVAAFVLAGGLAEALAHWLCPLSGEAIAGFVAAAVRLLVALALGAAVATLLVRSALVNRDMVVATYVEPIVEFFRRYGSSVALLLLALIGLYRISDIVLGVIANVFYQDLDFSKEQIATVVKTFGLFMTIAGGFLGGVLTVRFGVMRILMLGALLTVVTNLAFILLAVVGKSEPLLYLVISADNLTAGLASAAFIAFLSSLTNIRFTAVQYAIFSSLMTLLPKVIGGYSGGMVDGIGYVNFFLVAAAMGVPVLWLVWLADRRLRLNPPAEPAGASAQ